MTAPTYLMDSGPLVAILNRRDRHHRWAIETIDNIIGPIATCEAVISEAWFLTGRGGGDPVRLLDLLDRLKATVLAAPSSYETWLRKYPQRTSVADAALLALADEDPRRTVCTVDSTDFGVYRLSRRRRVPALMPPD